MISLPVGWQRNTAEHIAKLIVAGSPHRERTICAAALITAALDLLIAGRRKRTCSYYPDYTRLSTTGWRINEWTLSYHSKITDATLSRYRKLLRTHPYRMRTIIVPSGQRDVLRTLLLTCTKSPPDVVDLEGYLDLRVLFTAMDMAWTIERTLYSLVDTYNNHIRIESPSLVVSLPTGSG